LNAYEVTYIIASSLSDDEIRAIMDKYAELVKSHDGEVVKIDTLGKKRLAYEINGHFEGFYVCMNYKATPATTDETKRLMGLDEKIVRSLFIRLDK
jgi:small subunit ribosomal protein S6